MGRQESGRIISLGSLLLLLVSALTLWVVVSTSGTWGYFSNTLQELATITTGFWEDLPGQAGTSISATKSAHGRWELVDGTAFFVVYGEICITNSGEQPTENLAIRDVIQEKQKGEAFEDTGWEIPVALGDQAVLPAGKSHCYPYDLIINPVPGYKYRNVAYVSITNHSGWQPGGNHCPGPELCPFGPAPKSGFEVPSLPDPGGGNSSKKTEYLPETGPTPDPDAEGKLIELPSPPGAAPTPEPSLQPPDGKPSSPPEEAAYPTPTPAPTQDVYALPTSGPVYPAPITSPTPYTGSPGCTRPKKYWLNHPGKWNLEKFYLGYQEFNQQQALDFLEANPQGEAGFILAQQFITALLNTATPADPAAILEELREADAWFQRYPLGTQAGNLERKEGLEIAKTLEAYNLGDIGPGSCEADQSLNTPGNIITPTSTNLPAPTPEPTVTPTAEPATEQFPTPAPTQTLPSPTAAP